MKPLRTLGQGVALDVVMLSMAFVGIASAHQYPTMSNPTPFSAQTGYVRCPVISGTSPTNSACSGLRIRKPLVSSANSRSGRWSRAQAEHPRRSRGMV